MDEMTCDCGSTEDVTYELDTYELDLNGIEVMVSRCATCRAAAIDAM